MNTFDQLLIGVTEKDKALVLWRKFEVRHVAAALTIP